ncbi:hypothetical protein EDB19DRAFT_1915048 [Suillus lakei]|nr:hypothetical protein EDB19DRAFT_1915048 [Suillus lakei]
MASSGIPLDTGALMSAVLEGILYGFSVLMFIGTIWALIYKRRMQDVSRPITVVAILLLVVSTVHMVVTIIRVEDGLVKYRDTYPGGPVAYFGDLTQQTYVIKHGLYILQTLLADGVLIYRCYVVWQSVRVIILPSMLWCSVAVTGIHAVYSVSQANTGIFAPGLTKWIAAFFASTITTNLLSSGLLAYRIWIIERDVCKGRAMEGTLMPIVRVLIDAAVLYSVVLFSLLICFVSSNNGESVLTDLVMPIMSITFYMVLIRIAINRKNRGHLSVFSTAHRGTTDGTEQANFQQYPMKPLQVHISQFTQDDRTSAYKVGGE